MTSINQFFKKKIAYNDSNFNLKKKVDQKSTLMAEIISKLQAIKEGKIKINGEFDELKLNLENQSIDSLDLSSLTENDMLAILK